MGESFLVASASEGPAAIHQMDGAGGEACLVAGELERERRDLLGRAESAERLAGDESLAHRIRAALRGDAVLERWRLDGAGTDGVAADALLDVVDGDRLGEADHRRLAGAVDEAVGCCFDRG